MFGLINQVPASNNSEASEIDKTASSADPTSETSSAHCHGTNIREKEK